MRARIPLLLIAAITLPGACATPAVDDANPVSAAAAGAPQTAQAAAAGPKIRECRYAKSTGSKMRTRICHLQEEWARIDAATAQAQNTDAFFRSTRESATTGASGSLNSP